MADWRDSGACLDEDPEMFFNASEETAKAVCQRCPVRAECLEWAIESRQNYGVWGGTTEDERRALWRRPARVVPPEVAAVRAEHERTWRREWKRRRRAQGLPA